MSGRRALLESLLALLTGGPPTGFGLRADECGLTSGGRPPAVLGKRYFGLHSGGGSASVVTSLIEQPRLHVTGTFRVNVGADKIGPAVIEGEGGAMEEMEALVRYIASANRDYAWFNAANARIGPDESGFKFLPLRFELTDPTEVGGEWFQAGPATTGAGQRSQPANPGVKVVLTIFGLERERYVETVP